MDHIMEQAHNTWGVNQWADWMDSQSLEKVNKLQGTFDNYK